MDMIATNFNDKGVHEFPGIIGAIDGSHIQIEPPSENPQSYYNRKRFHSVILQGICKDDMQFIHTNIGWPGRVHDAKVLKNSDVWDSGYQKCDFGRFHLLGDAAYPLRVWLLTPYRDTGHLSRQQTYFNKCLSSKRQIIERAFGLLKGRFHRLKYIYNRTIKNTCEIIQAACILYNVCICSGEELEDFLDLDENLNINRM
ncbi:putative nuclease HARBI1 [Saccostrea echinata]|uniref:putative nuclease HARBI1 n=1 Tax=Saccostrea echinata TaxID=191078 RepID=UPI002A80C836|nr:putative nuclease HARBI1 [Saccostrea echinata]